MNKTYDVVVLGGGMGGYIAAIRASQLGKSVALVERDKLGGTCLHRGCIPSKALLRSAELFAQMKASEQYGIAASDVTLQFDRVQMRKTGIVDKLHKGVQYLMKKHRIDVVSGNGRIVAPSIFAPRSGSIAVELADGESETLVPEQLIIATGSRPRQLQGIPFEDERIMTSDEALAMERLPESILIIGGGVIGVEWASMLGDFGVKVTVAEYADRIVPTEDEDVSKELEKVLVKRGIRVLTGVKVLPETAVASEAGIALRAERRGETIELQAERVLVSIGRAANVEGIGLENTDVVVENGAIKVNGYMQTAESHIYAVGDVIGGLQLAHVAGHEGIVAAEHIAGQKPQAAAQHRIPRCIYTRPEIASVGWTERQAKERGMDVAVGRFPFSALGKAQVYGESAGFVKVVADRKTNDIVGVHMIGPHATDLISEAALAQLLNATPWEAGQVVRPHPSLSEAFGDALLAVDGHSVNL